jgi:dTDP-4-amino-4,6-dideoxygalactose transaminase
VSLIPSAVEVIYMLTQLELDTLDEFFESALVGRGVVAEWERGFAEFCGVKYAFGTASGTMALYLALKAVGIKTGDEVIVPALDWYAATAAALHLGAIPVFADTEPNLPTISPLSVEERITERTKAIVATHLFGYPCNMPAIRSLADRHGIPLVEDCAQVLGATCHGKKVGAWGDAACFSFGVGKALCCGEGGMIVTDRDDIAERILASAAHPLRQEWEGIEVNPFALRAPLNPIAILHLLREWEQLEETIGGASCDAFDRINAVLNGNKSSVPPVPPRWLPTKRLPFCRPRSKQEGEKVSDDSPFGCWFARQRCLWGEIALLRNSLMPSGKDSSIGTPSLTDY